MLEETKAWKQGSNLAQIFDRRSDMSEKFRLPSPDANNPVSSEGLQQPLQSATKE
jgi:hypothetical protein